MARKPLDSWIKEALSDNSKDAPCNMFVLCHMVGMSRVEIQTTKIGNTAPEPKELANMFHGKADAYCQDMRGDQNFVLDAYYGSKEPGASQPFRRSPQADAAGITSYPPTEEGRALHRMHWESDLLKSVYQRQEQMDRRADRFMDASDRERTSAEHIREKLMEENMKMFTMMKDLMVSATLDQHKQHMEALAYARSTQREQEFMKMAPIAINAITGKEIVPQSHVDTAIIEALARKLQPEHIPMLSMLGLSDAEMGFLMQRLNQAKEKEAAETEARKQLPNYNGTGEEDVTGGTH
jgi:hypothetical protein